MKTRRRHAGILGPEVETLRQCQRGRIQATGVSLGALAAVVPELRFLELPYLFPSLEAFQRLRSELQHFRRPEVVRLFEQRGLFPLVAGGLGWRNISSVQRAVRSPADLQGLRVRAQPSELHLAFWRSLGAMPRPVELTELSAGLDLGLFEAFDVPAPWLYGASLQSRIKHHTLTRHVLQIAVILVHLETWNAVPVRVRDAVIAEADRMGLASDKASMSFDEELIRLLPEQGVAVIEPTSAELGRFRAQSRRVHTDIEKAHGPTERRLLDLVRRVIARASER